MPCEETCRPAVLVVADEPLLLRLYARVLEGGGFAVWRTRDGYAALDRLAGPDVRPLLVVADLNAPMSGARELGAHLTEQLPALPVLRVLGRADQSGRLGADDCLGHSLPKPVTAVELLRAVQMLCALQPLAITRTTRQGLPTARTFGGRSRTTTLPAPTTVFSPMLTPGHTIAPPPSQTPFSIETGSASSSPEFRVAASSGCVQV